TPFLCYLETLLSTHDMPEVWLHYANRNSQTQAYGARLQTLARLLPRLRIRNYFSHPLPTDPEPAAMLDAHVVSDALIEARARFYMCGPPAMMDNIRAGLCARRVPRFDIFSEVFRSPTAVDTNHTG